MARVTSVASIASGGLMKNHPEIAVSMLPVLVRRLREADAKLAE